MALHSWGITHSRVISGRPPFGIIIFRLVPVDSMNGLAGSFLAVAVIHIRA
jgi:hypothetical protein